MYRDGLVEVEGGRVWFQQFGNQDEIPLLVLHGGPGSSCLKMVKLSELQNERPVILYDQLGCGKSDRPKDLSLWQIDRFVRELAQLRSALGLEKVHILGHSWGTMLLADYLLGQPDGVESAIFSSPCLSAPRWIEDAMRYRQALPESIQAILNECEAKGTTDSSAYEEATKFYTKKHVCRVQLTEEQRALSREAFGKDVYYTMWGPSEFYATGNLKNYDRTDRLHEITVPSLFTCGQYDEASPESTQFYQSLVPQAEYYEFENCSHTPILESPEEYKRVIRNFLNRSANA